MFRDFQLALRLLGRSPLAATIAVATLAVGIGAPTAVFTLIDALLLRPVPAVRAVDELVVVRSVHAEEPLRLRPLSWADSLDLDASDLPISKLAMTAACDLSLTHGDSAERVTALAVNQDYFAVLGVQAFKGRFLATDETQEPKAVLGYDLWQHHFGGDPRALGSPIRLNGRIFTVSGIAPPGFWGADRVARVEIWLPLATCSKVVAGVDVPFTGSKDRQQEWLSAIGRLRPGANLAQLQAALDVLAPEFAVANPATNAKRSFRAVPLAELTFGPDRRAAVRRFLLRLTMVTLLLLSVAVINLAGYFLALAASRRREIAIRLALGATRGRLFRQLASEGLLVGLLGAGAGGALVGVSLPLLETLCIPADLAIREIQWSGRSFSLGVLAALFSSLLLSLAPIATAWRDRIVQELRGVSPARGRLHFGWREAVVVLQLATALPLLSAAGYLIQTVVHLRAVQTGFRPAAVLAFSIDLAPTRATAVQAATFFASLNRTLQHLPGVQSATMVSAIPVLGSDLSVDLTVERADGPSPRTPDGPAISVRHVLVGAGYFRTMGIPFRRGSDFDDRDLPTSPAVAIVNETAARRLWPGINPLGRRLRLVQTQEAFEIKGVAADTTYANLREEPVPVLYLAHAQAEKSFIGSLMAPGMTLLVRGSGAILPSIGSVRAAVHALDPRVPVFRASTLADLLASTRRIETQTAILLALLATVAVVLALLGLFAALDLWISENLREIGIRIACGASQRAVGVLLVRRSALLVGIGAALGSMTAPWLGRLVGPLLFGVTFNYPVTWVVALLLLGAGAIGVTLPRALRAARVDPVNVLEP